MSIMWHQSWVALDTETTGLGSTARVLEIGLVYFELGEPVEEWGGLLNPPGLNWDAPDVQDALRINGLSQKMCEGKPTFWHIWKELAARLSEAVWVGHNIEFDLRMLKQECQKHGLTWDLQPQLPLCTKLLDFKLNPQAGAHKLMNVADRWNVHQPDAHRAVIDAKISGQVLSKMVESGKLPTALEDMQGLSQEAKIAWSYRPKGRW